VIAWNVAVHSGRAPPPLVGCVVAEYRLDELARVSGVSARNIRAYRERGLLDPPRRVGRSAYYDDYHLSQLKTINQLLRKGFNSAHIAEFFESMRQGADLADILGIQRAVLGLRTETAEQQREPTQPHAHERPVVDIDPQCAEARRLVEHGLAELVDGAVVLVDRTMGEIVARAPEPLLFVRAILRISESTRETIDQLAAEVVEAMEECVTAHFGPNYLPKPGEYPALSQIVQDYRDLGTRVAANQLDEALQQQLVTAASKYTTGIMLSGQWEPKTPGQDEPRDRA
jgi:DNA-binding transcriptional MerR regulator